MEGSKAQMFVSSKEVTTHAQKGSACLERDSVGIWNTGLMSKPLADTYRNFLPNKGVIVPAHITTVDIIGGGVQVPQPSRTAKKAPAYAANYLPFPSIMFRGSSFLKEGNRQSFGPALNGVDEMGLHKTFGHIFGSSQTQPNKVDVQLSEVCQRRFVMFDRCGSKRRMIFHPSLMNEFPALLSSSLPPKTGDPLPHQATSHRGPAMVASPILADTDPVGPAFPNSNSHLLLRKTYVESHSSASDNCDNPILSGRDNAGAEREEGGEDAPELSSFSHENTEDLEALLSSDEEDEVSSTGHSPSDLTRNISPLKSYSNNEGHSLCGSKKRKNREENNMEDEDACSTATSGTKTCKETPCKNVDATGTGASYGKESYVLPCKASLFEDLGHGNRDLTAFDTFFTDEVSSSSSANNQKWDNKLPFVQQQQQQQQQQQDGLSRKEKIKSVLRLLRGIIPGGESMDTAFVLDEAIQYVKTLQFEVQKLQARKLT